MLKHAKLHWLLRKLLRGSFWSFAFTFCLVEFWRTNLLLQIFEDASNRSLKPLNLNSNNTSIFRIVASASVTLMSMYIISFQCCLISMFWTMFPLDSIIQLYDSDDEVTTVRILDCHISLELLNSFFGLFGNTAFVVLLNYVLIPPPPLLVVHSLAMLDCGRLAPTLCYVSLSRWFICVRYVGTE